MTAYHPALLDFDSSRPYVRGERVVLPSTGEIVVGGDAVLANRPFGSAAIFEGGANFKFRSLPAPGPVGGLRGVVSGFSVASRLRLRQRLLRVGFDAYLSSGKRVSNARALFVTLTYPKAFPVHPSVWKSHLKAFRQRLERSSSFRPSGVLWKLEFQERGAVHFHMVVFFPHLIDVRLFRSWAARSWAAVVSSGDARHVKRGCHAIPLYGSSAAVMAYLSKYISKGLALPSYLDEGSSTGRVWGVWWTLPDGSLSYVSFPRRSDWYTFLRRYRRWRRVSRTWACNYCDGIGLHQLLRGLLVYFGGDYFVVS